MTIASKHCQNEDFKYKCSIESPVSDQIELGMNVATGKVLTVFSQTYNIRFKCHACMELIVKYSY